MNLLREVETAGVPDDYLFARIRFRRAALDTSGQGQWAGPADPHRALKAEHAWIYAQLNRGLRRKLLPFFEYTELGTLIIALRHLSAGDPVAMEAQLQFSLLHPQLRKFLMSTAKITPLIRQLENLLSKNNPFLNGLTEHYLRQGPGGLEQALLGGFLQQAAAQSRCQPLREMLHYLLDMRNLLALYKHLHWKVPTPPPLLRGGKLPPPITEKIWATQDMARLLELIQKRAGQKGDPEAPGVEDFLFAGLTRQMYRAGRNPLQAGLILDYLWRCRLASRKRGVHLQKTPAPPEAELAGGAP